ncbi:AraC family transcriptional regulator [Bdellovibrio bacteriovorus]|uniref:AraC family transcriptional regulator n=1 Tax=Bdellovibrio bacteriovorus TaxID=959 RepID=UPI0021CE7332|nr:AraC family transcriptional regulator [Bdellovibrio bacteriovorus]UXR65984.1 AraC family transcriptional regulator [Bdellovibrio bacteriovorus]
MLGRNVSKLHSMDALGIVTAQRGDIRAERLEERVNPKVPFPHRHDFFQVVIVTAGKGQHNIDFNSYPLTAGNVFVVKPGQVHQWQLTKGTRGYVVEFYLDALRLDLLEKTPLQSLYDAPDVFRPTAELQKELRFYCEKMCVEFAERKMGSDQALRNLLSLLALQLLRTTEAKPLKAKKAEVSFMREFEGLLEKHFSEQHNVDFYARTLGISPKALTMRVLRLLNKSARDVIHERCLLEAQRYLAYTNLPIGEISFAVGFQDPNYFSRFFRAKLGQSPGQFRDRYNKAD